jgi:hypothetical protein
MAPESRVIFAQWLGNKAQKQLQVAALRYAIGSRSALLSSLLQNKEELERLEKLRTK